MDLTRAVDTLAKHQYSRLRAQIIEDHNLSDEQIPSWDQVDHASKLLIREDALADIEKVVPFVEQEVLATLAKDERFGHEAAILINDLAINKDLEIITENL